MNYLIRFVHIHESFRIPELEALAALSKLDLRVITYEEHSPFCIVRLESQEDARALIARSILSYGIYELWGSGQDYPSLHNEITQNNDIQPSKYRTSSFRFTVDSFHGKRNSKQQRELIESFSFLPLEGPIHMENAQLQMCIFEDFDLRASAPKMVHLGRWVANSSRNVVPKHDLKKRRYISRTSMDAELSLVTANMVLAGVGKLAYDPFVGTGSFTVACAHFGAATLGSDIDSRSVRGTADQNVVSNFDQYGLMENFVDIFIADLTHTPLVTRRFLDAIICDPPYGIREGPKVLGKRQGGISEVVMIDGRPAHLQAGYVAPKRPYGFDEMLRDVLHLAATMLVDAGRLGMWMPAANDDDIELAIPRHPALQLKSVSVQAFNKWSRRLLTYERLPDANMTGPWPSLLSKETNRAHADDLNNFRRKFFQGFRSEDVEVLKTGESNEV